jgi:hypothetical protein
MIRIYALAWIPMVFIAIANGAARDKGYGKYFAELRAHQISTLSAAILFALYAWALSWRWPLGSGREALIVGAIWLGLTIAFEVVFGRFVAGHPWQRLALDYDVRKGRVWVLLLVWLLVLPSVVHCLRA